MPDVVHELVAPEVALAKLGARSISADEVGQLPRNRYAILRNPHGGGEPGTRRFLIGLTDERSCPDPGDRADHRSDDLAHRHRLECDGARTYPARGHAVSTDPWTSEDPQPGDLDDVLASIDAKSVEYHDGDPTATLRILVSVDGEDALRLERIAGQLGKTPHDVVSDLLRDADRSAASAAGG